MGRKISMILAALLALECVRAPMTALAAGEPQTVEGETARIEQVYTNLPEAFLYAENLPAQEVENAEAYLGQEKLELTSCGTFSESGEGISYYVLLDISGSIPKSYFETAKNSIQEFQDALPAKDKLVLCTFGDEVTLAADGTQTADDMREILAGLKNKDQETLLFEAIDRVGDLADADSQNIRRVLVVMTDGEDFATGKKQAQEAQKKLRSKGLPAYAFCISETAKENINSFGEFSRTSGGDMTIFTPADGETPGLLTGLSDRLENCIRAEYTAQSNVVSNEEETFTLKFADGTSLPFTVMNNRWIPDTEAPYLVSSEAVNDTQLRLVFSEPLLGTDNPANYSLSVDDRDIGISSVSYEEGDNALLNLFLAEPAQSGTYTLACSNITDASMEKNPLAGSVTSGDTPQADAPGQETEHAAGEGAGTGAGTGTGGMARLIFEIAGIPGGEEKPAAPPKEDSGYVSILFLIFLALVALAVAVIVLARKKKTAAEEPEKENSASEPQGGSSQVIMQDGGFKQHVVLSEQKKAVNVWLSRQGMQTQQTVWEIGNSLFVGRDAMCDVVIDDRSMSKQHFCLENDHGEIFITDLESTNGTAVNGIRVNSRRKLESGTVIEAGSMKITLRW